MISFFCADNGSDLNWTLKNWFSSEPWFRFRFGGKVPELDLNQTLATSNWQQHCWIHLIDWLGFGLC
jgi:hypothetical protein